MKQREKIGNHIRLMFAQAEIRAETPKARQIIARHLPVMCCSSSVKECDVIFRELADSYTGEETGRRLGDKEFGRFAEKLEGVYGLKASPDESLAFLAEKVYWQERERMIGKVVTLLAEWEIPPRGLVHEDTWSH